MQIFVTLVYMHVFVIYTVMVKMIRLRIIGQIYFYVLGIHYQVKVSEITICYYIRDATTACKPRIITFLSN